MIRSQPCVCRLPGAARFLVNALLLGIIGIGCTGRSHATGYFGPVEYLQQGGKNVDASPEFYWELEVKRLARDFHPPERRLLPPAAPAGGEQDADAPYELAPVLLHRDELMRKDADAKERAEASKQGLKPDDSKSEFSDYANGAGAYNQGEEQLEAKHPDEAAKQWEEARKAWEGLLNRPASERHYRSVWAAYMLGKVALKKGDPKAVKWFQLTRDLARQGFADSLGLAADSYGWEARGELEQNHPEKAAPLYLTQLALGDESAIVSLKALIPDIGTSDQKWSAEEQNEALAAAKDPLLRRLETAHILAISDPGEAPPDYARWLAVVKEANLGSVEDAEYLGWVAYAGGDYKAAARWLELAKSDTPAACWLRAKLQRRAGELGKAVVNMEKAWRSICETTAYTGWTTRVSDDEHSKYVFTYADLDEEHWTFPESAGGDLAALHLARGDFVQAMDAFLKGRLWEDAAFIAERVLSADELKAYTDQQPVASGTASDTGEGNPAANLRYLLGRRLVREDRYKEAAGYLPPPWDKVLRKYAQALTTGADETATKLQRAHALFTAAWLARHDGMELMGTEVAPDGFVSGGAFESDDLALQRQSGVYQTTAYENGEEKTSTAPIVPKPSSQELDRLAANRIRPDLRFHYRMIAGALAMRAAGFLKDDSEELADVVNTAGWWVKDRDEKIGDRYYEILARRCAHTKIGRAAIARHWFVDEDGLWSQEQQKAHDAMYKKLGIQEEEQ